jgi:CBS domain-containing protein
MNQLKIRQDLPVLQSADTLYDAINTIEESGFGALPVLKQEKLVGVVSESDLERYANSLNSVKESASQTVGSLVFAPPLALRENSHTLEAAKLFRSLRFDLLPVVGEDSAYLGAVTRSDADHALLELFALNGDGILMEIEIPAAQFRMSELIRLLEQNDAQLLGIAVRTVVKSADEEMSQLATLNLYAPDAYRLQRTLERHGYAVTYNSQNGDSVLDDSSLKAQEFIRYLEV